MNGSRLLAVALVIAFLTGQPGSLSATPLLCGTWEEFVFGLPGTLASPTYDALFTAPTLIRVTDAWLYGDAFRIVVHSTSGSVWYTNPVPKKDGTAKDGDTAWADPGYSHGAWMVAAGSYHFDIYSVDIVLIPGGAFIRAEAIPLPGTLLFFASGLVGLATLKRRLGTLPRQ